MLQDARPHLALIAAVATLLCLLALAESGSAATVADIAKHPDAFDQKTVTVTGTAYEVRSRTFPAREPTAAERPARAPHRGLRQRFGEGDGLEISKHEREWREQLDELKGRVTQLETEKSQLAGDLSQLRGRVDYVELSTDASSRGTATFDPADSRFQRIETSVASFAVSVQDVWPYADGVRLRLNVGNLPTASVNGATFKAKWGARMPRADEANWVKRYEAWNQSLQEQTINFT